MLINLDHQMLHKDCSIKIYFVNWVYVLLEQMSDVCFIVNEHISLNN